MSVLCRFSLILFAMVLLKAFTKMMVRQAAKLNKKLKGTLSVVMLPK